MEVGNTVRIKQDFIFEGSELKVVSSNKEFKLEELKETCGLVLSIERDRVCVQVSELDVLYFICIDNLTITDNKQIKTKFIEDIKSLMGY